MATVTGAMTTTNVLSDQLAIDIGDQITLLEPDVNPLTLFTRRADKRRTVATQYSAVEDARKARFDATSGAVTNVATTVAVVNGPYFAQWDLVQNTRTGEVFRVDSVATNNLTVTRNIAPSGVGTGIAMNSADELMIIGTAQPENDTSKPARSDIPVKVSNNTQIFRTPFESSDTLRSSGFQLQPTEWNRQAKMKGIEHSIDIESAFIWGKRSTTTPGQHGGPHDRGGSRAHHDEPDGRRRRPVGGGMERVHGNVVPVRLKPETVPRVRDRRERPHEVPGIEAADHEQRDDVRHERHDVHQPVRERQPRVPPSPDRHEVRRLRGSRRHGQREPPVPRERRDEPRHEDPDEPAAA
jgi:hypothetical protein